jgi:hypothetical protein
MASLGSRGWPNQSKDYHPKDGEDRSDANTKTFELAVGASDSELGE